MCTSDAPASFSIRTIFFEVVPRTIESSMRTMRFPSTSPRTGFSFTFTPKLRMVCFGSMNVRPT